MLHLVVRPPRAGDALARALAHARPGDIVLLAQDAAPLACAAVAVDAALADALRALRVHVLAVDLAARGLDGMPLREDIAAIDDAAWVALAADCDTCVTWA